MVAAFTTSSEQLETFFTALILVLSVVIRLDPTLHPRLVLQGHGVCVGGGGPNTDKLRRNFESPKSEKSYKLCFSIFKYVVPTLLPPPGTY